VGIFATLARMLLMAALAYVGRRTSFMVSRRASFGVSLALAALHGLVRSQLTAAQAVPPAPPPPSATPAPDPAIAPAPIAPPPNVPVPFVAPGPSTTSASPRQAAPQPSAAGTYEQPINQPPVGLRTSLPTDESLEARVNSLSDAVEAASHLKITGFIQAQYVHYDTSDPGVDASGKPKNKDVFEVRRARLRATYTLGISEYLLNVDAIPSGVSVKEAEVSMTAPWTEAVKTKFTIGLMYIPFGYESQESDSVLPFIERSALANRLFPGQRDIGLRAAGNLFDKKIEYQVALMNGNPISDAVFPALDPNGAKDVVGRVGVNVGGLRAGISGLWGKGFLTPAVDDAKTANVNEAHGYRNFDHGAAGFDIVYKVAIPVIGPLALYAEGVIARNLDRSAIGDYPKPPTSTVDGVKLYGVGLVNTTQRTGYIGFLQNLTQWGAIGARAEIFDPSSKSDNTIGALTFVGHVYPTEHLRLTVAYQANFESPKVANNIFWLRGQVKF
jgi:hypothetical protein